MNSSRGWWTSGARVTFVHGRRLKERVLQIPRGFDLFQWLVGAPASKRRFVTEHVRANPGDRILDLGCGTGAMRSFLPGSVTYVGVEIEPAYVSRARRRFGERGTSVLRGTKYRQRRWRCTGTLFLGELTPPARHVPTKNPASKSSATPQLARHNRSRSIQRGDHAGHRMAYFRSRRATNLFCRTPAVEIRQRQ